MVEPGGLPEASMELQMLTVSDPAARSHMMRHVVSLRKLLTGAVSDEEVPGLMIATTFGVTDAAEARHLGSTDADGIARVVIAFEVDDAKGRPHGYGLFLKENGRTRFYHYASPWIQVGGTRALLSASNGVDANGFFAYRGGGLVRVATPDPKHFKSGYRRASDRIASLADSDAIRAITKTIYVFASFDDAPE